MNLKYIIEKHIQKFGSIKGLKSKKYVKLLTLLNNYFPTLSFPEQAYLIINNLKEPKTCIDCAGKVNFINFNKGYQNRCKICGNLKSSETIKLQRCKKIIEIKQYCKHCNSEFIRYTKNEKEINKPKIHFCSKKCATTYNQKNMSSEIKAIKQLNTKETNKQRYNNEYVVNSEYSRNKTFEKLGVKYPFQDPKFIIKSKDTLEYRTGYRNPLQNPVTVKKMISTKLKKYGDLLTQCFTYKNYTFPSGKCVKIQGYENIVIDKLLLIYEEKDIIVGRSEISNYIGEILYIENDKLHKYYPDIFIISENKIIEVKSNWTYNIWKEKNELKKQACLDRGFNFNFIIL